MSGARTTGFHAGPSLIARRLPIIEELSLASDQDAKTDFIVLALPTTYSMDFARLIPT